ncbi:MAG: hypothetical protein MI919_33365, partial [Holophagales bacterium]|nr:hypothetical protein [Holophagales bacterium]
MAREARSGLLRNLRRPRRAWPLLCTLLLAGTNPGPPVLAQGTDAKLVPVPIPALTGASADVEGRIADALERVDRERASGQPASLAEAFGELGMLYL